MFQIQRSFKWESPWLWYGLSGVCLGIGFLVPPLWWTVFIGIAGFFIAIDRSVRWQQAVLGGWLAFTIKMLFSIGWFWTTYPIILIDLSLGAAELPVIGFYWSTVAMAIGVSGGILAGVLWKFRHVCTNRGGLLVGVLLWPLSEILGAWLFSVFTYGTGGSLNTLFSFGMAGYHLAFHPWLLLLANWGGVYVLSLLAVFCGIGLYHYRYQLLKTTSGRWALGLMCGVGIMFMYIPVPNNETVATQTVAVIDTRFGGAEYFARTDRELVRLTQVREALRAALQVEADYVIMPEDSRVLDAALTAEQGYRQLRFMYGDPEAVVVEAGAVPISQTETTLRATVYDGQDKQAYATDKQFLVPQGEYMPNFYLGTLSLLGFQKAADDIRATLAYRPGPLHSQADFKPHIPGILFCFADADPLAVRSLLRERDMPFVAHPISHAWFYSPESLWYQFDAMLTIQAIWNNIPIVSAGNMVSGALYTPDGRKVAPEIVAKGEYWTVSLIEL
jgi:apolipoprotein N-acyltransferase